MTEKHIMPNIRSICRLVSAALLILIFALTLPVFAQEGEEDELICDKFEGSAGDIRVGYYMGEGAGYFASGQYVIAIDSYSCALEIDSAYVPAYINRALAHVERRDFDAALEDYSEAISRDSANPELYNNRGIVYIGRGAEGDFDLGLDDFNEAISLDGDYLIAYNNRGILHAIRGEYAEAIADFEQALVLDETYAQSHALIGMVYSVQSLDSYRRYLELAGDRSDRRIQAAAASLESRFTFELRFDDSSWLLEANLAD
jgi:tetratricopeptide (TPR) repeat protein